MAPLYKKLLNGKHNLIFKICQGNFNLKSKLICFANPPKRRMMEGWNTGILGLLKI